MKQFEEKETNRIKKRNELKKLLIKILYISFLFVVCCFGIFLYITDKKIIGSFIGLIAGVSGILGFFGIDYKTFFDSYKKIRLNRN